MLLMGLVAVFFVLTSRKKASESLEVLSRTQETLQKDLSINYPQTPRAVVRYYAELSQCMYDSQTTGEELGQLGIQSRKLLDDELVAGQTDAEYLASLNAAVAAFAKEKRRIISFTISSTNDVQYNTNEYGELATLFCYYTMQKENQTYSDNEQFILRKDDEGHWKILGWQQAGRTN